MTVCLTSCRISFVDSKSASMDVVSIFKGEVDDSRAISYEYLKDEKLLPYFSIDDYLSLYNPYLKDNYSIDVSESSLDTSVRVTQGEETIFMMAIEPSYQIVMENGDFSSAFVFDKDYSKSSLFIGNKTEYEIANVPTSMRTFTYKNMGFYTYRKGGHTYYPLSLLECIFSSYANVYHLFNYNRLIQYSEYKDLTDTTYKVDGVEFTAYKEMKKYIDENLSTMPMYLRKDRKASFLFTLENQYGLKYTRNIKSMTKYLEEQDFFADFLSEDNLKRNEAYYKTFELLDDGHTSIRDHADFPYREGEFNQRGTHLTRMLAVRQELSTQRALAPGEVYYSTDEKLAFFTFDSFSFAEYAYQEDGKTLKDTLSNYHSEDYDAFFYFVKLLNQIKDKGGVTDVVIDISTNGGGTVGVMTKLLSLLSKRNTSRIYVQLDVTNMVQQMTTSVDSNNDGEYDLTDVFGNDFNFHILTSEFSFSCGNAFPFYAKENGIADIIGVKSGGGECAVGESYLPSGEHYYHSSNLHIGWLYDDEFVGDEAGVAVDIPVEYKDFYDLDKLQSLVTAE